MVDPDEEYDDDGETRGCGPCARGGGLLLLAVGLGLGWIGADLLTGGALTRLVTGGAAVGLRAAATVIEEDDDDGDPEDFAEADVHPAGAEAAADALD